MKTLTVNLADRAYPIMVGEGLLASAGALLAGRGLDTPPVVVANSTVLKLHGATLLRSLEKTFGKATVIRIGDGERYKNHATLFKIYEGMFRARADRRSWVLAFGGGVVGDIAGFAAATFMRGIPYVMIPTTLLAQVDSSIGGKVGINVEQGKNLIGAFHQPSAVLSDTGVLKTLPKRELATGLYEVVKYGAIQSKSLLRYLEHRLSDILKLKPSAMQHIVLASARIKARVVASDERESGMRMILNYGHSVGHAFEAVTEYRKFKHGEAVGWGMIAALGYGRELGLLSKEEADRLIRLIRRVGSLPSIKGISLEKLWDAFLRDKKFRSGNIRMIFLRQPGEAEIRGGIDPASLRHFLKGFLESGGDLN
ncbi:MAG: 3-dehydroquinate synthase [Acidobacteriota bacterium]|nr:3-dehydroquinate synthase [Acidobacteriota bacterium]